MDGRKQRRTNSEIDGASASGVVASKRKELSSLFVYVQDGSRKRTGEENSRHEGGAEREREREKVAATTDSEQPCRGDRRNV